MRTDDEIVEQIESVRLDDWLGFETNDLLSYLPFARAEPYVVGRCTEIGWEVKPRDRASVLAEMLDYMPFAWRKAQEQKALSADRTMSRYKVWTWMLGNDLGDLRSGYTDSVKSALTCICQHYGWDCSQWDACGGGAA